MKKSIGLAIVLVVASNAAVAFQEFRDTWRDIYPNSRADDISDGFGCQLCHQGPNGMEPWNAYGWRIREQYRSNGFNMEEAIRFVELENSDDDPRGAESIDEILADYQPGWTNGPNNTVTFANGTELHNQSPPSTPSTTEIDFPPAVADPVADVAGGAITIALTEVAGNFTGPLKAVRAPGIDGSLFVVEQTGGIFRVDLATGDKSLFHSVGSSLVSINVNGYDERGLLGMAFHPQFASNGLFYTYQSQPRRSAQDDDVDFSTLPPSATPNHRSMIVEHQADDPSCNSRITQRKILMIIDQPQGNHNGGDLAFGDDGFLYVSLGDGGGANDQGFGHGENGTGRDNSNPLGSILRVDPLGDNAANGNYGIPADNPFVGTAGLDEIYAYGFRNPFRMSFDALNGDLYTGDVGQREIEEIDLVIKGGNYGWNWKEGSFSFYNPVSGAYVSDTAQPNQPNDLIDPIAEYDHDDGISVTGGYLYRGTQIGTLSGKYVFADYAQRLFYLDDSQNVLEFAGAGVAERVAGFGQDADNELYILTRISDRPGDANGKLQKLVQPGNPYQPPAASAGESAQCPQGPLDDSLCIPVVTRAGPIATICL